MQVASAGKTLMAEKAVMSQERWNACLPPCRRIPARGQGEGPKGKGIVEVGATNGGPPTHAGTTMSSLGPLGGGEPTLAGDGVLVVLQPNSRLLQTQGAPSSQVHTDPPSFCCGHGEGETPPTRPRNAIGSIQALQSLQKEP